MSKAKTIAKEKGMDLEQLIAETEQKITDSEYEKDTFINYHGTRLNFRMRVITQKAFEKLNMRVKQDDPAANRLILEKFLINKETGKPFTSEQIGKLFTGGLVGALAVKIVDESDFNLSGIGQLRGF